MPDIIIYDVPDDLYQKICSRAKRTGRMPDDEARAILIETISTPNAEDFYGEDGE